MSGLVQRLAGPLRSQCVRYALAFAFIEAVTRFSLLTGSEALFERDLNQVYYPLVESALRSMSEGAWPLRDVSSGFGQPLLADPSSQVLYPPTWLHLFLPPPLAYSWIVSLHFVLGAVGTALWARRVSGGTASAGWVAGFLWWSSGPVLSLANLWHHLCGAAWMPWVLLAVERVDEGRKRWVELGAVFGAQILAGSADMCAMTILIATVRIVLMGDLRLWKRWLMAGALGALLGAGAWLPALELIVSSGRAAVDEGVRTYWSVHPASAIEMVAPLPLSVLPLQEGWRTLLYSGREPFLGSLFLGLFAPTLFCAALADRNLSASRRLALGATLAVALLTSFGAHTPAYRSVVALLPPLAVLRYPVKAMLSVAFLVAVGAGLGVVAIRRDSRSRLVALWAAGLHAAGLLVFVLAGRDWVSEHMLQTGAEGITMFMHRSSADFTKTLAWMLFFSFGLVRRGWGRASAAILAFGHLSVSGVVHDGLLGTVPAAALTTYPPYAQELRGPGGGRTFVYDYNEAPAAIRRWLVEQGGFPRLRGFESYPELGILGGFRAYAQPLIGAEWGVRYAWDRDLRLLFDRRLSALGRDLRFFEATPMFVRLLELGGVERVVALHDPSGGRLRKLAEYPVLQPAVQVFEVSNPLPYASLLSGRRLSSVPDRSALLAPEFDPRQDVVVDSRPRPRGKSPSGSVQLLDRRADRVVLDVDVVEDSFLLILEATMPGWRVSIDGTAGVVERANAVFVGAEVPRGAHRVEFLFRPWFATIGVGITCLVALAISVELVRRRRDS